MRPRDRSTVTLVVIGVVAAVAVFAVGLSGSRKAGDGPPAPTALGLGASDGVPSSARPELPASGPPTIFPAGRPPGGTGGSLRVLTARLPDRIELYAGDVSVVPGQPVSLHVSTSAGRYAYHVMRLDATRPGGGQEVARASGRAGGDLRQRATFDPLTRVVRANWPVTDTLATEGWSPGVYVVTATDSEGTTGRTMFVVRTAELRADQPAFVFPALTEQAYNLWGGANLYAYRARRAVRVSFERPSEGDGGLSTWGRGDDRILAWLQQRGIALQFTTDYDLSIAPPPVAPKLLILGRHTEYVGAGLYDFVERHVNGLGDMNVLNFGADSFYWQIRLSPSPTPGAPMDIVCYRSARSDPLARTDPASTTTRWRDPPLRRPEGRLFGAQYTSVLGDAHTRYAYAVTAQMPTALLAGTGWRVGTVVRGLLLGEGDVVYPGSAGIAVMDGRASALGNRPLRLSVTIRTSPVGARIFNAGTFAWGDGFEPAKTVLGVSGASFDRFNRNVLAWLGFPPTR